MEQEKLWSAYFTNGQTILSKQKAESFLEKEAQSLEERYLPRTDFPNSAKRLARSDNPKLRQISERCQQFEDLKFDSSTLQEEQERELSPEIEQERQIQRAASALPEKHVLAPEVRKFAVEGILRTGHKAYFPAHEALRDTTGAESFDVGLLNGNLMVTSDFVRTVVKWGSSYRSDQFQRSVQWIISGRERNSNMISSLLIISPFEANLLQPEMRRSRNTKLHLYKARCNSGFPALDTLDLYTTTAQQTTPKVPRQLAVELNLFAGQLYIGSFDDYQRICTFLGLTVGATPQGWEVTPDGFIVWDGKIRRGKDENPVQFVKFLMTTIRRNGLSISKTHMAGLLEGKLFQPSDFEDQQDDQTSSKSLCLNM